MKAKHFKKLRLKGKWYDCYYRYDILRDFKKIPIQVFSLNSYQAAFKCMMRKNIEQSSRSNEALTCSETFGMVIVYPQGSRNIRFRKVFH